jgi:glycosyltransferase involved in cell wall biosynthesis
MLMPGKSPPLILLASNTLWSIANFRIGLISRLMAEGYRVAAVAPDSAQGILLPCELIPIRIDRRAVNPAQDILLLLQLIRIFRARHPFVVLTFTPKLNVYGVIAARWSGARALSNVSGFGSGLLGGGLMVRIMHALYRHANGRADVVFFQNGDDLAYFTECRLVDPKKAVLVPGSGVDLGRFQPRAGQHGTRFAFLLIARLLKDKGIVEYVEAARVVRRQHAQVRFQILGQLDPANPSSIREKQLRAWVEEGTIEHLGWQDDVRPSIADADCVVLPSYREGTPRTLLEAAAMARPVIAADVAGCRQVVEHGRTGFLCGVRDSRDLAEKMLQMIELPLSERRSMGIEGRRKMEREFDEKLVIDRYLQALQGLGV